jgi:outer membrane cobalamin receptor
VVLQWHATRALTVYTRIGNLLDAHYETAFDRPGLPRNAALGLRLAP